MYRYIYIYIYIFTGTNILVWHCVISYRRLVSRDVRYSLTWPPPCELCLHVIWLTCCHSIISNLLETTLAPALHTCSHACVCVPPEGYIFRSLCFSLSLSHSLSVSLVLYLYINTCTYNVMYICIHVYIQMFQVHPGHTLHINNVWHACVISYQTCMYASLVFERHLIGKGMHIIIYIYIYSHYISSCMCYIYILSTIYPLHPSTLYSLFPTVYSLLSTLNSQLFYSLLSRHILYIYIIHLYIFIQSPILFPLPVLPIFVVQQVTWSAHSQLWLRERHVTRATTAIFIRQRRGGRHRTTGQNYRRPLSINKYTNINIYIYIYIYMNTGITDGPPPIVYKYV